MAQLTTTSYLVLGILASREFSAYEIAEQVGKGVTEVWPRADRQLYNAPKVLVAEGLATVRVEYTGRRRRSVYAITSAGREALRAWMATPVPPASLEFPGMLRLLMGDQGSLEDLRATLEQVRAQAETYEALFASHLGYLDEGGGTFPEREHLMRLANRFMLGHYRHLQEWASWALDELAGWSSTTLEGSHRP